MQDFRKLTVWQASRRLARRVYQSTVAFPAAEKYGLSGQMRRAAVSICSNIAEGCGRSSNADLRRFLFVAMGSACELECETILAQDLALFVDDTGGRILEDVQAAKRMLAGLIKRLEAPELTTDNR